MGGDSFLDSVRKIVFEGGSGNVPQRPYEDTLSDAEKNEYNPWRHYNTPVRGYFEDLKTPNFSYNEFPTYKMLWSIVGAKSSNEVGNKQPMILDVFGQCGECSKVRDGVLAEGWTLRPPSELKDAKIDDVEIRTGDLFDKDVLHDHIKKLESKLAEGVALKVVFMRPLGGLSEYSDNLYAHIYYYEEIIRSLYKLLDTHFGMLYVEMTHFKYAKELLYLLNAFFEFKYQGENGSSGRFSMKYTPGVDNNYRVVDKNSGPYEDGSENRLGFHKNAQAWFGKRTNSELPSLRDILGDEEFMEYYKNSIA